MANRTEVIILQHPRERFHPLGTARIAKLGLQRSQLHVAFRVSEASKCVHLPLSVPAGTGLLYPHPDALPLTREALEQGQAAPEHLVVLDGTWSQAHRLYQDNPWLHALPHYRLDPSAPSRYRIRREPKPHCVSTIESIAMALRVLEPETPGIDALVGAFDSMIDAQIDSRPEGGSVARTRRRKPQRRSHRVPLGLLDTPERVVLVYGETAQLASRRDPQVRELMQWCAVRLDGSAAFEAFVAPEGVPASDAHLRRLGLEPHMLAGADETSVVAARFAAFLRPGDLVMAWNQSTLELLPQLGHCVGEADTLKAAYCNVHGGRCGTLEDVIVREGLPDAPLPLSGRAATRLGNARTVAMHLRARVS